MKKRILYNTIILTATSLLMRTIGMVFQVYLSRRIGAAGIGLYQLIMSVAALAQTFAISGIRFATTRIVSEELGSGNRGGIRSALRRCVIYAAIFGTAAFCALFFGADFIGRNCIGDIRTVLSLRLLAISLPCFALSSVFSGYFTAVCRVIKSGFAALAEQLVRIGVIIAVLMMLPYENIEYSCAAIVIGSIAGDTASFLLLLVLYLFDVRRYRGRNRTPCGTTRRIINIAMPLALSAYARVALSALQNLLIPRGLEKSGSSGTQALADYGMIGGMVFPVITFPAALFTSLSELMVPELTELQVQNNQERIDYAVNRILQLCLLFSLCIASILFYYAGELGVTIYKNADVGHYIRILSLLMPIMYLDSVADGMLRGLGQHLYSMYINIADSIISVGLVFFLLPVWAINGYIFMICFTEVFNFALSIHRLQKITNIAFIPATVIKALICAVGSVNISALFLRILGFSLIPSVLSLTAHITISIGIYMILLLLVKISPIRFNYVG